MEFDNFDYRYLLPGVFGKSSTLEELIWFKNHDEENSNDYYDVNIDPDNVDYSIITEEDLIREKQESQAIDELDIEKLSDDDFGMDF